MELEHKVIQDENHFEALLEHASVGIIEASDNGDITDINEFALGLFGYSKEELIQRKIETLIPSRFHSKHVHHRRAYTQYPKNRPMGIGMDLYAVKKDGSEFPVEVSLSSYQRNNQTYTIVFISDISIRKEAENKIRRLNDGLEEAVKQRTAELMTVVQELQLSKGELSLMLEKEKELNELKSRFVTMASHEFRTPLSTILSSAYLLNKSKIIEDETKRESHLDRIISSVKMLTDILDDFLNVGKIEEGKIYVRNTEFNLPDLIKQISAEMKNMLKKGQKIHYRHDGERIAKLDTSLLKHIVMNLVSNASKFSAEGGTVNINTRYLDNSLSLSVKDEGIGIPPEDQKHLKERFFRGSNVDNIQGTGLGLHIVSKYAELMRGEIHYQSELGKGTEFIITFNSLSNLYEKNTRD